MNTYCSYRGPKFSPPAPTRQFTIHGNANSRGSSILLWSLRMDTCTHVHIPTPTYNLKLNKILMLEKRRVLLYLDYACSVYTSNYHNPPHVRYKSYTSVKEGFLEETWPFWMNKLLLNFTLDLLPLQCYSLTSPTPLLLTILKLIPGSLQLIHRMKKKIYSLTCYSVVHLQMLARNAFALLL